MTLPGEIARVFEPSFHCSLADIILSPPPQRITFISLFKYLDKIPSKLSISSLITSSLVFHHKL